jgi:hypothetical protein
MMARQEGRCAICGNLPGKKGLVMDHDHNTGRARELLCSNCNTALGLLREDPARFDAVKAYIVKWRDKKAALIASGQWDNPTSTGG